MERPFIPFFCGTSMRWRLHRDAADLCKAAIHRSRHVTMTTAESSSMLRLEIKARLLGDLIKSETKTQINR